MQNLVKCEGYFFLSEGNWGLWTQRGSQSFLACEAAMNFVLSWVDALSSCRHLLYANRDVSSDHSYAVSQVVAAVYACQSLDRENLPNLKSCVISYSSLPAMQWHAHKRLFAFLSGNPAPLFLRLQYVLNVFIFRSFVKSLSMPIDSLLTTTFFLETKSLPSIPTKRYESEPDLPKPKLLLPNAGRSNRHCLSIEKTSHQQRRGKLTMSSRLAGWSPRLC